MHDTVFWEMWNNFSIFDFLLSSGLFLVDCPFFMQQLLGSVVLSTIGKLTILLKVMGISLTDDFS